MTRRIDFGRIAPMDDKYLDYHIGFVRNVILEQSADPLYAHNIFHHLYSQMDKGHTLTNPTVNLQCSLTYLFN